MGSTVSGDGSRPPAKPNRPRKARIKTTPDKTNYGVARIKFIVALLAAVGLLSYAASKNSSKPDPHYLEARRALTSYELGKPQDARNYRHPVYQQVLLELDQVDPESISAPAADTLKADLAELIRQYADRHAAAQEANAARVTNNKKRRSEFKRAVRRSRQNPVTEYPECEGEEK